jgi:hypothetical protein
VNHAIVIGLQAHRIDRGGDTEQAAARPQSAGSDVNLGEDFATVFFELRSKASMPICMSVGAMRGRVANDDCKRASVP